jgi:DNA polymerase-3 subunit gamma/tau
MSTRGIAMADALAMRAKLTRLWQMLLKALEEVAMAPNAMMAANGLPDTADLPSVEDLVRKLDKETPPSGG